MHLGDVFIVLMVGIVGVCIVKASDFNIIKFAHTSIVIMKIRLPRCLFVSVHTVALGSNCIKMIMN